MAAQVKKSSFASNMKKHAEAPIDFGTDRTDLPGDIHDGVAKLASIKRGKYKSGPNQGKEFLRFEGSVISPKTATDVKKVWKDGKVEVYSTKEMNIEGLFTNIMIPLCETKKKDGTVIATQEENEARAANEIKKLGGPNCLDDVEDDADIDSLFDTLVEQGIKFKFATRSKEPTKDYPNSGVWDHNWYGTKGLEDFVEDASDDVKVSEPEPEKPSTTTAAKSKKKEPEPKPEADAEDLETLAKLAADGDDTAVDRLTEIAIAAGVDAKEVNDADNWNDVVEMIAKARAGDEGTTSEEFTVEVNNIYVWTHPDPANPKKKLKDQIQVQTINTKNGTCTVKMVSNGKPILDKGKKPIPIPITELSAVEE